MESRNKEFKKMIESPGVIVAPGVYDAMGARIVQKAGFKVCYMTGNGVVASSLGLPDIGLATMTEMTRMVHNITARIDLPLICDSDNGYGDLNNTWRAVREFEAAGASAIHIEDQVFPKRCGAMAGVRLNSQEEAVEKIKIALKARTDPNFMIIARTDARRAVSMEDAISRVKAYANAGADIVFVEQLESLDEIRQVARSVNNAPLMYDILEESRRVTFTVQEVADQGAKIVIFALSSIMFAAKQLSRLMKEIADTGTTLGLYDELMPLHDYEDLMGLNEERNIRDLL